MEVTHWEWKLMQVSPDRWTYETIVETIGGRTYRAINRNGKAVLHKLALRNAKRACIKLKRKVEARKVGGV